MPDVEGGILAARKKRGCSEASEFFQSSICSLVLSAGLEARLYGRQDACHYEHNPMLDYWLRMMSGAFALVGGWYLVLMLRPKKYCAAIPWFGCEIRTEPDHRLHITIR